MADNSKRAEDVSSDNHEPKLVKEEAEMQKEVASPASHEHERVTSPEDPPKKTRKSSEQSPLHHHSQAKLGGKVNGGLSSPSPSWERKVSSETTRGAAPLTPGRSRTRSTNHATETVDEGPSVPKFGEWDESDPASADGYTQIFNIVKEERQGGAGSTPSLRADKRSTKEFQFGNRGSKAKGKVTGTMSIASVKDLQPASSTCTNRTFISMRPRDESMLLLS